MDTDQLNRRIAVSRDYDMLQGLIPASLGVGLVLGAVTGAGHWLPIYAGAGTAIGTAWYEKRYGKQHSSYPRTAGTVLVTVVVVVLVLVAFGLDRWHPGAVLWTPLVSALALAVGYRAGLRHVGMTPWHWAAIALCAAGTLVPLSGWHPSRAWSFVPAGLALVIIGIVDHRRLVATLGTGVDGE